MFHLVLWAILAVWMGLALLILVAIVATLSLSTIAMLRDRRGISGTVWCLVFRQSMRVLRVPASFGSAFAPYADLRRCERFGRGRIRCHKWCLRPRAATNSARTS